MVIPEPERHALLIDNAFNALEQGFEYRGSYVFKSNSEAKRFIALFNAKRKRKLAEGWHYVEDVGYWHDNVVVCIHHKLYPLQAQGAANE